MAAKKANLSPKPLGRPSDYCDKVAAEVCHMISISNKGLQKICNENPHLPGASTIYHWLTKYPIFQEQYAQAKRRQIEVFIDDIADLANTDHVYLDEQGIERYDYGILRIKIDSRKWLASKLVPKVYGERQITESTVTIKHEDALGELE
jgi:hypothetical protein